MLFNSYIFVFLFFPLVVTGYYVLHHFGWRKAALGYLTMMSMVFYGYNSMAYLVMLVVSILVNFFLVRCMGVDSGRVWRRRAVLLLGLLYNLGILFYFKYVLYVHLCGYVHMTEVSKQARGVESDQDLSRAGYRWL